MTKTPTNEVVGLGAYFELRRVHADHNYTAQIILLPEGRAATGHDVPMTGLYRRLSDIAPRKTWKTFASTKRSTSLLAATGPAGPSGPLAASSPTSERTDKVVTEMLEFTENVLTNMTRNGYKAVGDPIVFEVTQEDLSAVRLGKTPYKVVGRINKVRKFLKYPAEVIAPATPSI